MFISQVAAILAILITWMCYAAICVGLGAWYLHGFSMSRPPATPRLGDFFEAFWAGSVTLLGLLQFWHFLAPIDITAHVALLGLGLLGFLAVAPALASAIRATPRRTLCRAALALLLIALWLANRATGPCCFYDAGLYHIANIQWTETYRIIPGLANLHMRFGFSTTMTLLAACMDHGAWTHGGYHILNGFFLTALTAAIIRSATRLLAGRGAAHDILLILCTILITDWGLDVQASSYSTDIGTAVMTAIAAYYFLEAFAAADAARTKAAGLVSICLSAAAITAKASALVLSGPMIAVMLVVLWRASPGRRRAALAPALLITTALLGAWLVRQSILSGYPLYPSELISLPVDWKMPYDKVHWYRRILLDWARWISYDDSRGSLVWVRTWWTGRLLPPDNFWKTLAPAVVALIALAVALIRRRKAKPSPRGVGWLLLCLTLAILAWCNSAPDPRYASQIFILLMACGLLLALRTDLGVPAAKRLLIISSLLACAPFLYGATEIRDYARTSPLCAWILPPPQPAISALYPIPHGDYTTITTPSGLVVYIPKPPPGKMFEDRIWDGPLPSAPRSEIQPTEVHIPPLRLRHPPSLQDGFTRQP